MPWSLSEMKGNLWQENCVAHYDDEVLTFFHQYFGNNARTCLHIGGAGFDPRSADIVQCLSKILKERLVVCLIKEERPNPDPKLIFRANANLQNIRENCNNLEVEKIDIFSSDDNAVTGGRNAISSISKIDFSKYTDVVIDMSALSMGVSYPIVSFFYKNAKTIKPGPNVHLALISNPELDSLINSIPNDRYSEVHGFALHDLMGDAEKARLWLPFLSENKEHVLEMIHAGIAPHDTCPILPFPSEDPQKGDRIAFGVLSSIQANLGGPLENEWGLDLKDFVYADERKPLDIYRTILRIDDERKPVFETFGGSTIILSPLGSKMPTIGALMAAMERQFPVVYVEALGYNVDWCKIDKLNRSESRMAHIWLWGDAYMTEE
ncbi:MAG: hypothetical protein KC643_02960 [Nitrospira sp.]|nr:hypothetical protein [Nitrospira sp.]